MDDRSQFGIDHFPVVGIRIVLDVIFGYGNLQGMHGYVQTVNDHVDVIGCHLYQIVVLEVEIGSQFRTDPVVQDEGSHFT